MIKTQVQIPDNLYREARRIAHQYEMSFAEVVRRGLERMIPTYPDRQATGLVWQLPAPMDLDVVCDPFENEYWREEAEMSGARDRLMAEGPSTDTQKTL